MKMTKRIFSFVMVLALCFSLAIPAMAADAGKVDITIKQKYDFEHTYEAYMIFSGTLVDNVLSDIKWGSGVDGDGVIEDLKSNDATKTIFAKVANAQAVADLLSDHKTSPALVDAFRHIVSKNLTDDKHVSTGPVDGVYTIANVDPGYYFIKDETGSLKGTDETYTNYILEIVGDTDIYPKSGEVTHDKEIRDGGNVVETSDYSIGDKVTFVLTGNLPYNYSEFDTYAYKFVDTLSAGLTFNNDVKVYLGNAGTKTELNQGFVVNFGDKATESGATFTVDFKNLKEITDRTIDDHTNIYVEYTATVNANAVVGGAGNSNTSYIIFNNDPHTDEKGETPKDHVFVFTWELDVTKIDGDNNAKLEGAEFVLYRELSGVKQYVQLDGNNKVKDWVANEKDATVLKSNAGGEFKIIGLEADKYYLKETKAPAGYHLLDEPIGVDIMATVKESADGTKGEVTSLQIKVDTNPIVDGDKTNGTVAMQVVNNPGATLPETGGVGTTMFYVAGAVLAAAAVVLLITKKRMAEEK